MQKIEFKNGLLYTDLELSHEGKTIIVKDVIVDTGASHTIIIPEYLEEMNVGFSEDDTIVRASGYGGTIGYSVRKLIDKVSCKDICVDNIRIDFGEIDPEERVNGLLGLDFLKSANIVIDLVDNTMVKK
ncbi:retropepsin-like domain-containing protein [Romboutsia lituseburensis]|uniref:retropepsin-like domain-containing protein n=1 Tax=Romboutsia lituseburensis TaxID=1537 RepID=UPI00215AAA96|nr:retropepsin-like domain-containing protein [Romboutsia lituseburensis]MCR8744272.1 retropepsin-like domain-containing protein [Romboutsia lituseburensis]